MPRTPSWLAQPPPTAMSWWYTCWGLLSSPCKHLPSATSAWVAVHDNCTPPAHLCQDGLVLGFQRCQQEVQPGLARQQLQARSCPLGREVLVDGRGVCCRHGRLQLSREHADIPRHVAQLAHVLPRCCAQLGAVLQPQQGSVHTAKLRLLVCSDSTHLWVLHTGRAAAEQSLQAPSQLLGLSVQAVKAGGRRHWELCGCLAGTACGKTEALREAGWPVDGAQAAEYCAACRTPVSGRRSRAGGLAGLLLHDPGGPVEQLCLGWSVRRLATVYCQQ